MSLSNDYEWQFGWRDWQIVFDALPSVGGQAVLDLGGVIGDQAAEFVARGARVIGIDMNAELIREARSRQLLERRVSDGWLIHSAGSWVRRGWYLVPLHGSVFSESPNGTRGVGEAPAARRLGCPHGNRQPI
jgi:hypothetical protein